MRDFYHGAHRVQKVLYQVTGRSGGKATKVTIVRNKLVEHPDHGDYYTFGYSANGPTVGPVRPAGREWIDEGLIPNAADFVARMKSILQ